MRMSILSSTSAVEFEMRIDICISLDLFHISSSRISDDPDSFPGHTITYENDRMMLSWRSILQLQKECCVDSGEVNLLEFAVMLRWETQQGTYYIWIWELQTHLPGTPFQLSVCIVAWKTDNILVLNISSISFSGICIEISRGLPTIWRR